MAAVIIALGAVVAVVLAISGGEGPPDDREQGGTVGRTGRSPTPTPSLSLPSQLPSDLPTLPSGFPSDLPSGFPSELPGDLGSLLPDQVGDIG
ncbi:hypothetical protein [Streptomyces sp. VNUA24]|uniref:hypothetical protein n=1 Tax=Streptomyces sp. VNUA24 TaxID=3031131 RepID=UPI0023B7C3EB|nr:hypothetical protein [Streptomyces sp. VNUA24]WEH19701.1 hypothetical protein PYR72_40920 [Streptomyces sp. VNUA24]